MAWDDILKDPEFQTLDQDTKNTIANNYFEKNLAVDPEYQAQPEDIRTKARENFLRTVAPAEPERTVGGTAVDVSVSALKGIIALPQAAVGVLDIPTGGYAGKLLESAGYQPEKAKRILDTFLSPAQQAANLKVAEAEGFFPTLEAMVRNPSTIVDSVVESIPSMLGGAAAARGLLTLVPKLAPITAAALGEGTVAAGAAAEQLRLDREAGLLSAKDIAASIMLGAGTSALGIVGGRVAKSLGIDDVDVALATVRPGKPAVTGKGVIRRVLEGGISEGLFEELPQSMQEQIWMNAAQDKPLLEGVDKAAASGLLAGAAMGGGFNIFSGTSDVPEPTRLEATISTAQEATRRLVEQGVLDTTAGESAVSLFADLANPEATPEEYQELFNNILADTIAPLTPGRPPEVRAIHINRLVEEQLAKQAREQEPTALPAQVEESLRDQVLREMREARKTGENEAAMARIQTLINDQIARQTETAATANVVTDIKTRAVKTAETIQTTTPAAAQLATQLTEELRKVTVPTVEPVVVAPAEAVGEAPVAEVPVTEIAPEAAPVAAPAVTEEAVPVAEAVAPEVVSPAVAEEVVPEVTAPAAALEAVPGKVTLTPAEQETLKAVRNRTADKTTITAIRRALNGQGLTASQREVVSKALQIEAGVAPQVAPEVTAKPLTPKAVTPEALTPGVSFKMHGDNLNTYSVVREVTTPSEKEAGELWLEVKNDKSGEVQVVSYPDIKGPEVPVYLRRPKGEGAPGGRKPNVVEIESLVSKITSKWKNKPETLVVENIKDLPARIQASIKESGGDGDIVGIFDPLSKKVYLVAANIGSLSRAERALIHEILGHFGIRALLGNRIDPVLDQVYVKYLEEAKRIAKRYKLKLDTVEGQRKAAEEVLANLAETNEDPDLINKVIALVRSWLRGIGLDLELSDNDIRAMLAQASALVKTGRKPIVISGEVAFARLAEGPVRKAATEETYDDARKIDAVASKAAKTVKRWAKRNFLQGGLAGKDIFETQIEMEAAKNAGEADIAALVTDFDKAVTKAYGVKRYNKMAEGNLKSINDYLGGNDKAAIPASLKPELAHIRAFLDRLSDGMVQSLKDMEAIAREKLSAKDKGILQAFEKGTVEAPPKPLQKYYNLIDTIEKNKGTYLTQSYQAFDDPKWRERVLKKKGVVRRAEDFIRANNPELDENEVKGSIDAILRKAEKAGNFTALITRGTKVGTKDVSITRKRKDIPQEIMDLLGVYKEPKINFVKSASKMQHYIANHNFLMSLRRQGLGTFLFEKPTKVGDTFFSTELAAKGTETYNPLNGLYTSEDIKQGLEDASDKFQGSEIMRNIIRANSIVKYGKTILAPTTQARNFMSAAMFTVMNGHLNWSHMAKAGSATWADLFTHDKAWREYLNRLIKLGVMHDTPFAGELKDAIKDFTNLDVYSKGPKQNFNKVLQFFETTYRVGDDFWKIVGFENEVAGWKKAGFSKEEAEKKAAQRIRDGYPTYSKVPRGIKQIRRWPLIGTFVSFPYEIVRTTVNQLKFIQEDMKDPRTRPMAMKRALGFAVASGISYAASVTSMMLMGMDSDDDEAVRDQLPEWSKNSQLFYTGFDSKTGLPTYLDLSYMDPYTYVKKPLSALLNQNNRGVDAKIEDAMREFLDPFIGADIAAGAIGEIVFNQKLDGGQVYNPEDEGFSKATDIMDYLRQKLQPGVLSNMERTVKAIEGDISRSGKLYSVKDEGLAWVGLRFGTLNIPQSMIYKGYGFRDRKSMSTRILDYTVGSAATTSEVKIRKAVSSMVRARSRAYTDMIKLVDGAQKLGMDRTAIRQSLRASGVSLQDIRYLLSGKIPRWRVKPTFLESATKRALASAPTAERRKELRKEMRQRRNIVQDALRKEYSKEV